MFALCIQGLSCRCYFSHVFRRMPSTLYMNRVAGRSCSWLFHRMEVTACVLIQGFGTPMRILFNPLAVCLSGPIFRLIILNQKAGLLGSIRNETEFFVRKECSTAGKMRMRKVNQHSLSILYWICRQEADMTVLLTRMAAGWKCVEIFSKKWHSIPV